MKVGDAEIHGLVAGRACRLLLDAGVTVPDAAADRLSLSLSRGNDPAKASAWLEGFLSGSGLVLVHDARLLGIVDRWLTGLTRETFEQVCPIARRTFSTFEKAERRQIGEKIKGTDIDRRRRRAGRNRRLRPRARRAGRAHPPVDSRRSGAVMSVDSKERLERWRLLLGGQEADGVGFTLTGRALAMDRAMAALYDGAGGRRRIAGRIRAERRAMARRHPRVLSQLRRPRHAEGRDRAARHAAAAAGAGNAVRGGAGPEPAHDADGLVGRDPAAGESDGASDRAARRAGSAAAARARRCARR